MRGDLGAPRRFKAVALVMAGLAATCAPAIDAHAIAFPHATDLSHCQTFSFERNDGVPSEYQESTLSAEVRRRVRLLVAGFLETRGFLPGQDGETDLTVRVAAGRREREEVRPVFFPHPRPTGPAWFEEHEDEDIVEGMLVIDVRDGRTQQPFWHGATSAEIDPQKIDDRLLKKATAKILASFPWSRAIGLSGERPR